MRRLTSIPRLLGGIRCHRVARDKSHAPIDVFAPHHGNLKFSIKAAEGENVHDLTERSDALQDLLECACGGISACSTCHVILDKNDYDKLEQPEEAELDMLDLAWGVTSTSRLGCQLNLNKDSNNMTIIIPEKSNNLF